ncbi:MAG: hypothetical protein F4027_16585, partial [Rhodospirillaceae bacterium]|nr:hypothetical protein [Rhodospirillaceae bacterium]
MTNEGPQQLIRVYKRDDEGNLYDDREDFTIEDFCGTVPRVGDMIVSRWLRDTSGAEDAREKARLWEHRTVQVVEAVYFRPDKRNSEQDNSWVVIVVRDRQMTEA